MADPVSSYQPIAKVALSARIWDSLETAILSEAAIAMTLPQSEIDSRLDYARGLSGYETQRKWYSTRAGELKKRAQLIDLIIIGIGAVIAAVPSLISETYVARVVSVLGIAIAVLQGGQRIYRSGETWPEYRQASENMKREMRLFAYGSGIYDTDIEGGETALYRTARSDHRRRAGRVFRNGRQFA